MLQTKNTPAASKVQARYLCGDFLLRQHSGPRTSRATFHDEPSVLQLDNRNVL